MSKNYIKLQNQGTIFQNLMLLNEMENSIGYSDEHGHFTKYAIAEIAIKSYIITSEGRMGEDILEKINEGGDETYNSVLQNAKQRMQILRVLGLVSTDYDSEIYAITDLGKKVLARVFPTSHTSIPDYSLLREAFMGISSSSEVYKYNVDFNSYLGYEICYAFSSLDYRISTKEMPMITTYALDEIGEFVGTVKTWRSQGIDVDEEHEHFPKTQQGKPLRQASNITRTINQILRICEIIEKKESRIDNRNYYVCTEFGKDYVDEVKKFLDKKSSRLWTSEQFRRENRLKQKELANIGYNNMLDRGGYSVEPTDKSTVFSPYQLIPENDVNLLLEKETRNPPKLKETRIIEITSQIPGNELKLKPSYFTQEDYDEFIRKHITKTNLIEEILAEKEKGTNKEELINTLTLRHKNADKTDFYPFVHSLFMAMGIDCFGEVGRIDGLLEYNGIKIPVEIKSFTETEAYNAKGLRQSLENKIIVHKEEQDLLYASLLVGYSHPSSLTEIHDFIDAAYEELGIKLIAFDLRTLVIMCVNTIWDKEKVDFDKLLESHGIVEA